MESKHNFRRVRLMVRERRKHLEPIKQLLNSKLNYHPLLIKKTWEKARAVLCHIDNSLPYIDEVFVKMEALFSSEAPINEEDIEEALDKILISEGEELQQLRTLLKNKEIQKQKDKLQKSHDKNQKLKERYKYLLNQSREIDRQKSIKNSTKTTQTLLKKRSAEKLLYPNKSRKVEIPSCGSRSQQDSSEDHMFPMAKT